MKKRKKTLRSIIGDFLLSIGVILLIFSIVFFCKGENSLGAHFLVFSAVVFAVGSCVKPLDSGFNGFHWPY